MKVTTNCVLVSCFLAIVLCLSPVYVQGADNPKSVMDMVPYDSLVYVSLSNLDELSHMVAELPEWQEMLEIEYIKEDLEKARQGLAFGPMLLGISIEDFLAAFAHNTALSVMGISGNMPIAGLVVDVRSNKEKALYAIEQAATIPAVAGGAMIEEEEYRGVPCTIVGNNSIKVKYGFLGDFLLAGVGGGFEKLVDLSKDGGSTIKENPNFQFMQKKVPLIGEIGIFANLEVAAPILQMLMAMNSGEGEENDEFQQMLTELALKSAKAFSLSLNLSGHMTEMYLHLKPEEPHPITDLVLAPHAPMSSASLMPFDDGIMVGINIGDPLELLNRGFKLAETMGVNTAEIEGQIEKMEGDLGINLRDDLLSALTGEVAVMLTLPEEQIDLEANKVKTALQLSKTGSVAFVGAKDGQKLGETATKLLKLADVKPISLEEDSYKGKEIYTKVVPMNAVAPGLALMPAYAFTDGLMVTSNSADWVKKGIDTLESPESGELQEKLSDSRILVYLDASGIAGYAAESGIFDSMDLSEEMQSKISSLGSLAASVALGPDGAGIRLVSTSDDNWATKILRGVLIAIYANVPSEEEMMEEMPMEEPVEPEEEMDYDG